MDTYDHDTFDDGKTTQDSVFVNAHKIARKVQQLARCRLRSSACACLKHLMDIVRQQYTDGVFRSWYMLWDQIVDALIIVNARCAFDLHENSCFQMLVVYMFDDIDPNLFLPLIEILCCTTRIRLQMYRRVTLPASDISDTTVAATRVDASSSDTQFMFDARDVRAMFDIWEVVEAFRCRLVYQMRSAAHSHGIDDAALYNVIVQRHQPTLYRDFVKILQQNELLVPCGRTRAAAGPSTHGSNDTTLDDSDCARTSTTTRVNRDRTTDAPLSVCCGMPRIFSQYFNADEYRHPPFCHEGASSAHAFDFKRFPHENDACDAILAAQYCKLDLSNTNAPSLEHLDNAQYAPSIVVPNASSELASIDHAAQYDNHSSQPACVQTFNTTGVELPAPYMLFSRLMMTKGGKVWNRQAMQETVQDVKLRILRCSDTLALSLDPQSCTYNTFIQWKDVASSPLLHAADDWFAHTRFLRIQLHMFVERKYESSETRNSARPIEGSPTLMWSCTDHADTPEYTCFVESFMQQQRLFDSLYSWNDDPALNVDLGTIVRNVTHIRSRLSTLQQLVQVVETLERGYDYSKRHSAFNGAAHTTQALIHIQPRNNDGTFLVSSIVAKRAAELATPGRVWIEMRAQLRKWMLCSPCPLFASFLHQIFMDSLHCKSYRCVARMFWTHSLETHQVLLWLVRDSLFACHTVRRLVLHS